MAMDRRTGKIVISRKTKEAYAETRGTTDHVTANAGVHLQVGQFCLLIYPAQARTKYLRKTLVFM